MKTLKLIREIDDGEPILAFYGEDSNDKIRSILDELKDEWIEKDAGYFAEYVELNLHRYDIKDEIILEQWHDMYY